MLAIAFFFLLYLLISVGIVWTAVKLAHICGIKGSKWWGAAALFMYLIVFWDWLPMEIMHRHNCAEFAGFSQYKTLEEWKGENPGVAETLVPQTGTRSVQKGNRERYLLNQRFAWDIIRTDHRFHIREREERIVDTQTGEVLARYVDFDTDIPAIGLGANRLSDYKIWMMKGSCEKGDGLRTKPMNFEFNKFMYLVQHQREFK